MTLVAPMCAGVLLRNSFLVSCFGRDSLVTPRKPRRYFVFWRRGMRLLNWSHFLFWTQREGGTPQLTLRRRPRRRFRKQSG